MAKKNVFALSDDSNAVPVVPETNLVGLGGPSNFAPSIPAAQVGPTISSIPTGETGVVSGATRSATGRAASVPRESISSTTSSTPQVRARRRPPRLTQSLIDYVLESYSEQLSDPSSDHTKFFQALSSADTEAQLEIFGRVYVELSREDYTVEDYLVFKRKSSSEISIESIGAFSTSVTAAKVAGMKEKLYNGVFPNYGNIHAYIVQTVFNDPNNPAVLKKEEEGGAIFSQDGSLALKPRVSYYGGDSYGGYREATEDYWDIVGSYFTGTMLSTVTARTATIQAGSNSIPSVSPDVTGISVLNKLYKVSGAGEFGHNSSVKIINASSNGVVSSKSHLRSGSITFKTSLPSTFQTDFSQSIIDAIFNKHSKDRPYSDAALMADPARKPSYTSDRILNRSIDAIGRGLHEKLSRDEITFIFDEMAEDLVEFYDNDAADPDYEDLLNLPDIKAFVDSKLSEFSNLARRSYGYDQLKRIKFYRYIIAPFVGSTSVGAFSKETDVSSEFSALRSAILAAREQLISSGKFDAVS
jgi:hypothetical protein